MEAPRGPSVMPWVRVPIIIKHRYREFRRRVRKDNTTVSCVADLIQPPPPYEAVRRTSPVNGEIDNLKYALYYYRRQLFFEVGLDRELLKADIVSLYRWIEQLEYLVYWNLATTIPTRYRHEPIKDRIIRHIKRLCGEESSTEDDDDEFLGDEVITVDAS